MESHAALVLAAVLSNRSDEALNILAKAELRILEDFEALVKS